MSTPLIIVTPCGINQLYYEAECKDWPGIIGLALTPDAAVANLHKCREDWNYEAIRMMEIEAEGAEI